MKKILLAIILTIPLSGCLSSSGIFSTGAATVGAVAGTHLVSPAAGVAIGVASGLTADAVVDDPVTADPKDFGGENGEIDTIWELGSFAIANFFNYIITIGVILGVFWLLSIYIGARMPRKEEKAMDKQVKMLVDKIGTMKDK